MNENSVGGDAVIAEIRRLLHAFNEDPERWEEEELLELFEDEKWPVVNAALFAAAPRLLTACLSRLEAQAQALPRLSAREHREAAAYLRDLAERLREYPTDHYKEAAEALLAEAAEEEELAAALASSETSQEKKA